jgi:membrane-bound lytic murein transglycosylase D
MVDNASASLLKLRIQAVLERPERQQRGLAVVGFGGIAMTLLAMAAFGCSSTIQDRRISMQDATRMVAVAGENSGFPIAVNDRILQQINLLVATPDGRGYLQSSLDRMQDYAPLVAGELARRGLPAELMAIPLVESGYRNLDANSDSRHGAGLWMFIEPTADRYGLMVTTTRDDRLNVAAESRAAAQYLTELHRQFGDWNLAILAYNAGAKRVEEVIQATGSRDAWQILDQGFENNRDYLPRVIAAILVMKNPAILGAPKADGRL